MKRRFLQIIGMVVGLFLLSATSVEAGFGVSPTNIYNEFLKPGAHFEKTITISRSDPDEDLEVVIEPSLGEIESWFTFDEGMKFTFPKGETRKSFNVIIDIPENASYQDYEGVIRVKAYNPAGEVKGVSIVKGARLDVDLVTTEENITDLLIRSLRMLDSVDGEPLKLEIVGENTGNVVAKPTAKIVIKDLLMNDLETLEDLEIGSIEANETKTLYAEFNSTVPEGEYFVEAEVQLDGKVLRKERLVFRVVGQRENIQTQEDVSSYSFADFIKENWIYVSFGFVLAALVYLILTKLWESKKAEKNKEAIWAVFLGSKVLTRIVLSIFVAFLFSWLLKYINLSDADSLVVDQEVEKADDEEEVNLDITIDQEVEPGTEVGGVKGAKTKEEEAVDATVIQYRGEDGEVRYTIYAEPDINSAAIYYAAEGEDLLVLEENSKWYRVEIPDGTDGWLEKTSVKSSESINQ